LTILNATTARNNLFKVIEEAITTHEPVTITGKSGNVVLISEEDWRAIQETMYLSSIPGLKEKIIKGLNTSLEECVEVIDE
jgi:prevent-host-death family protein